MERLIASQYALAYATGIRQTCEQHRDTLMSAWVYALSICRTVTNPPIDALLLPKIAEYELLGRGPGVPYCRSSAP